MIIQQIIGNIDTYDTTNKKLDLVSLEWHETRKRILHKITHSGREIAMKFLNNTLCLNDGDILYEDNEHLIVIDILECDVIIVKPEGMLQMASVCYEIGNRHLSLYYQHEELLIAYDPPLYKILLSAGYDLRVEKKKLMNPITTSVLADVQIHNAVIINLESTDITT